MARTTLYLVLLVLAVQVHVVQAKTGRFWHFTDIHYEPEYKVGTNTGTGCFSGTGSAEEFGNMKCDVPTVTYKSSFEFTQKTFPNPDFIFWTGDIIPHEYKTLDEDRIITMQKNVTDNIAHHFPGVRLFPVIGNHDTFPQHQMAPYDWVLNSTAKLWKGFWKNPNSIKTFLKGGYYVETLDDGIKIIVVNTVFYYKHNEKATAYEDPADQFAWLKEQLKEVRDKGERCYVIGHVPPGFSGFGPNCMMHKKFNDKFLDVFKKHNDVIIAHFYGHLHIDAFRFFYDDKDEMASLLFLTGAVDEWSGINPQLRLFKYDTTTYDILDYDQYHVDLDKANKDKKLQWEFEYRPSELYGMEKLTFAEYLKLYQKIMTDDDTFNTYYRYIAGDYVKTPCTGDCKTNELCALRYMNYDDYNECVNAS